jgi:MOSC domain-containing protein YiiM
MTGRLIAIARRSGRRAPMEELASATVTVAAGIEGDSRGAKFVSRQITVLAREDWAAAMLDLSDLMGPPDLPWTTRRANLFVEGLRLPRTKGSILQIGAVILEVTGQTNPCHRMEEAHRGLLSALHPDWRGGVTCRVREGGTLHLADPVTIHIAPPEITSSRHPCSARALRSA